MSAAVRNYYMVFNTLLLCVFGVCMLVISARMLVQKVEESSGMVTEQAAYSMDRTFTEIVSQMVTFSSYRDIVNRLGKTELTIQNRLDLDRELATILKKTNLFNSIIQDIFVIADNGYVFSTITQSGLAADYDFQGQSWYQEAKNTEGNTYVRILGLHRQDFYKDEMSVTGAKSTFSLSFALENSRGDVKGALIYNFDLDRLGQTLRFSNYEENGQVALLSADNVILGQSSGEGTGSVLDLEPEAVAAMAEQEKGCFQAKIGGVEHLISFRTTSMGLRLVSYVPRAEIRKHIRPLMSLMAVMIIGGVCINLLIAMRVARMVREPVDRLTENIQKVDSRHLALEPEGYRYQELDQIAGRFDELLGHLDQLIEKDYKSRILINRFRLYSLQAQINPHFLMNTLQQLQTEIVYGNVESSNDIIVSLSKMLQYSLYHYEETVSVRMEFQYIRSYLELFVRKYEGELVAEYEIDPAAEQYDMPKMILQPVVENCIVHAFGEAPRNSVIRIRAKKEQDSIVFTVEDNGSGMEEEQLARIREDLLSAEVDDRRIGIRNIHQRIRMRYGGAYGVRIESRKGEGTRFIIKLPLVGKEEQDEAVDCG